MKSSKLIERTSSHPLEAICERLPEVAQKHKFGVLGTHDLKAKMASKGVAFDRECRVFAVCNPQQAKGVLECSMEISTALPCRISVYEEGGTHGPGHDQADVAAGNVRSPGGRPGRP